MANHSTIYALSSAPGRAGVAVIRVSGPAVGEVLERMSPPVPSDRRAVFRRIVHPITSELLDRAVVLFFAAPRSETGEHVAEFQVHGGRAVIAAVEAALGEIPGCRMAEPGEFARRAFLNGKLDLAEVEGLADLVDAETEAQRRQALAQSSGALSKLYESWRAQLLDAMALAEAAIDFSDEGDVTAAAMQAARRTADSLHTEIANHLADGRRGEILRDGFRVALLGAPNAGKSSLLNALARREAAIVSEEAGTTRDVIEVRLDLGGYPVIVSDTAGLREAKGAIEREGIRRSLQAADDAQLVLWLTESGIDSPPQAVSRETDVKPAWIVRTKADIVPTPGVPHEGPARDQLFAISAKTGEGLAELVARIGAAAAERLGDGSGPALTQPRHRQNLELARQALSDFLAGDPSAVELRAEDLRHAAHGLGRITGRVDAEDVLGAIFGRFCIGK